MPEQDAPRIEPGRGRLVYDKARRTIVSVPKAGVQPRVADNDTGEITVTLDGKELRGWSYANDGERRVKMLCAREYVEGWCDGRAV